MEHDHHTSTLVFVCQHGVLRSRIAAAYFNLATSPGWYAVSAGVDPQTSLGEMARRLLTGTPAEPFLDASPPRALADCEQPDMTIAIDCDVRGAVQWRLESGESGEAMSAELQRMVSVLAVELAAKKLSERQRSSWQEVSS